MYSTTDLMFIETNFEVVFFSTLFQHYSSFSTHTFFKLLSGIFFIKVFIEKLVLKNMLIYFLNFLDYYLINYTLIDNTVFGAARRGSQPLL